MKLGIGASQKMAGVWDYVVVKGFLDMRVPIVGSLMQRLVGCVHNAFGVAEQVA